MRRIEYVSDNYLAQPFFLNDISFLYFAPRKESRINRESEHAGYG